MSKFARIFLKPNEEPEIMQGFPWVFDNEIKTIKSFSDSNAATTESLENCHLQDGSIVELYAHSGAFLGTGVFNGKSKITVRMIGRDHADQIMADSATYWFKILHRAVHIRRLNYSDEDSYRVVFAEADFVPGLIVERYVSSGRVYLVVQFLAMACEVFRTEILAALEKLCHPYGMYERSDAGVREKEGLSERAGWIGSAREEVIAIMENGVHILVDMAHGQKTGYFLDQKDNRAAIARFCHGKRVLDTFAHTGAFGLVAFHAGAREVISVDISQEAVDLVRKNISLNAADAKMTTVCADVFDLLKKYEEAGEKFDVIILDPPAFTKSAKLIQKAYGGYKEINLRAMRLLNEGGILFSCSCSYYFDQNTFYSMLTHAARDSHRRVQVLQKRGAGMDHPVLLGYPKSEYLKCAICRVL